MQWIGKMKVKVQSDFKQWQKKLKSDMSLWDKSTAEGVSEIIDAGFDRIRENGFIEGPKTKTKVYEPFPGADKANRSGLLVLSKNKVVNRSGDLRQVFNKLSWTSYNFLTRSISGSNNSPAFKLDIKRTSGLWNATLEFVGNYSTIFAVLHHGVKSAPTVNVDGTIKKNVRKLQRRIVNNGLSTALRNWNKYIKNKKDGKFA